MPCVVCHTNCEGSLCDKRECKIFLEETPDGDYVRYTMGRDAAVCYLLVKIALYAARSSDRGKILAPFPYKFTTCVDGKIIRDFDIFRQGLQEIHDDWKQIVELVKISNNDVLIRDTLGVNKYAILKFVLMSRRVQLKLINKEPDLRVYQVTNTAEKEQEFTARRRTATPEYLFHGSPCDKWFSILRNGLRNCSGTTLEANGAAFGKGIYLGGNFNTSFSYSGSWEFGTGTTPHIVAVVEIAEVRNIYNKGMGTYVVPDERDVIIRYLTISGMQMPMESRIMKIIYDNQ